jgi:hypothetical protein
LSRHLRFEPLEDRRLLSVMVGQLPPASRGHGSMAAAAAVAAPSFSLTAPTSGKFTAGQNVSIKWNASNVTAGGTINLCYDKDTTINGNEKWIEIDAVAAANGTGSYTWNTTSVPAGKYYIGGYLWSGGKAKFSHLTQSITIQAATVSPTFNLTTPTSGTFTAGQSVPIQWTTTNVTAGGTINLCYDTDTTINGNEKWIEIDAVAASNGAASYTWNTTGVSSGTYYIGGYLWSGGKATFSHLTQSITIQAASVSPTFNLTAPTSGKFSPGQSVSIQWTASNVTAGGTINLCYDTDTTINGNEKWIEIDAVAASNGTGSYTWNTTAVSPGVYYIGGYLWSGGKATFSHLTQSFSIVANQPPSASVFTPLGTQTGDVTISYALIDANSDACSVAVQYSTNGGSTWASATKAASGGDGTTALASSPAGTSHTFVWASAADLVNANNSSVKIRITPSDLAEGTPATTNAFTVNNQFATFTITAPTSGTFTVGQTVAIQWTASNVATGSTISLCYDEDTTLGNGNEHWIELNQVTATNGAGTYNWNTTGVAPGSYYIAGTLWNGSATSTMSHLTQAITIQAYQVPNWFSASSSWGSWIRYGGWFLQIVSAQNADGRLEEFGIGNDTALWHRWQTTPNGSWSNWVSLGGGITFIDVGRNANGRLQVFAIGTDGAENYMEQAAANSTSWGNWVRYGGWFSQLRVAQDADGRLEEFAIGSDKALWHRWQTTPDGSWSSWVSLLGGIVDVRVARNANGRLQAFALGTDQGENYIEQSAANSTSWGGWVHFGNWFSRLRVAQNADGRLEEFAIGSDKALWHRWQTTPDGSWSEWTSLLGGVTEIEVATDARGCLVVFAIGTDAAANTIAQTAPGSTTWGSWFRIGGGIIAMQVARNADGRLVLFSLGTDRAENRVEQVPVDSAIANLVAADYSQHGTITRNDLLGIFAAVESDGVVSTSEFNTLQELITAAGTLNIAEHVSNLANKVVNGDPANWVCQCGNLYAGAPASVLATLASNWFLGTGSISWSQSGLSYVSPSGSPTLFGPDGMPYYTDVYQGVIGDCPLMAGMAELAARYPTIIKSMFTDNNDGTYTVRFYHNGVRDYLTVNTCLPGGGGYAAGVANGVMWPALLEKAVVQLNEAGWLATKSPRSNSYAALDLGGDENTMAAYLSAMSGMSTRAYSSVNLINLADAWNSYELVVLGSGDTPFIGNDGVGLVVPNHAYAMIDYFPNSTEPYCLFNPWGVNGGSTGGQHYAGQVRINAAALLHYFVNSAYAKWVFNSSPTAGSSATSSAASATSSARIEAIVACAFSSLHDGSIAASSIGEVTNPRPTSPATCDPPARASHRDATSYDHDPASADALTLVAIPTIALSLTPLEGHVRSTDAVLSAWQADDLDLRLPNVTDD